MWTFWPGFISFLVALSSGVAADYLMKLPSQFSKLASILALAISLYSVANGIYHVLFTWEYIDIFGVRSDARINAKGGIFLFLVSLWPFVAILVGALGTWIYLHVFSRV